MTAQQSVGSILRVLWNDRVHSSCVLTRLILLFLCFALMFLISATMWVYSVCGGGETHTLSREELNKHLCVITKYLCQLHRLLSQRSEKYASMWYSNIPEINYNCCKGEELSLTFLSSLSWHRSSSKNSSKRPEGSIRSLFLRRINALQKVWQGQQKHK